MFGNMSMKSFVPLLFAALSAYAQQALPDVRRSASMEQEDIISLEEAVKLRDSMRLEDSTPSPDALDAGIDPARIVNIEER